LLSLFSSTGKSIKVVAPGDPAEILGIKQILAPGSLLSKTPILPAITQKKEISLHKPALPLDVSSLFKEKEKAVNIILKTETRGELDAILSALPEGFEVVASGQGDISVADVILAQNSKALIIGFNVNISQEAENLAKTEKVFYKTYNIIYKLLEELYEAKEALLSEKKTGTGQIVAGFKTKDGRVLGIKVTEGKLCLGDRVELKRGEKSLGKARIVSLKHGKQDIKEAREGSECGAIISPSIDFLPGDAIIAYSKDSE
jgi:translation initiation factor IF-2